MTKQEIMVALHEKHAVLRCKSDSLLMRLVGFLVPYFCERFWTTWPGFFGPTIIYYPTGLSKESALSRTTTLEHELIHVDQINRFGPGLFLFLYLFFPLPCVFAYFRWRFEREAYLVDIRNGLLVETVVDLLWHNYGWCWPKSSMRKWFARNAKK